MNFFKLKFICPIPEEDGESSQRRSEIPVRNWRVQLTQCISFISVPGRTSKERKFRLSAEEERGGGIVTHSHSEALGYFGGLNGVSIDILVIYFIVMAMRRL